MVFGGRGFTAGCMFGGRGFAECCAFGGRGFAECCVFSGRGSACNSSVSLPLSLCLLIVPGGLTLSCYVSHQYF